MWKYYKNIVNVTLFFLNSSPDFSNNNFFFPPIFGNDITTIPFNFFPPPIFGNAIATITKKNFLFFPLFRQWHCCNWFFLGPLHTRGTQDRTQDSGREFGQRNFVNSIAEIQNLSLSNFSSFSLLLLLNFGNRVVEIFSLSSFR